MVLGRRIELLWGHPRRILSPLRLPVPPPEPWEKEFLTFRLYGGVLGVARKCPWRGPAMDCFVTASLSQEDSLRVSPWTRA